VPVVNVTSGGSACRNWTPNVNDARLPRHDERVTATQTASRIFFVTS
jgi:hypothetical protein